MSAVVVTPKPTSYIEVNLNRRAQIRKNWEEDFNKNIKELVTQTCQRILNQLPPMLKLTLSNGYRSVPKFSNPLGFDYPFSLSNIKLRDQMTKFAPHFLEIEPFKSWLNQDSEICRWPVTTDWTYFDSFIKKIVNAVQSALQNDLTNWIKLPENSGLKCIVETYARESDAHQAMNYGVTVKFWLDASFLSQLKI